MVLLHFDQPACKPGHRFAYLSDQAHAPRCSLHKQGILTTSSRNLQVTVPRGHAPSTAICTLTEHRKPGAEYGECCDDAEDSQLDCLLGQVTREVAWCLRYLIRLFAKVNLQRPFVLSHLCPCGLSMQHANIVSISSKLQGIPCTQVTTNAVVATDLKPRYT